MDIDNLKLEELKKEILDYINKKGENTKIYSTLPHPFFKDIPSYNDDGRWDIIKKNLPSEKGTVLDIGSNWGYFSHKFEEEGFEVYSVEHAEKDFHFLKKIKDVLNKHFKIYEGSIFPFCEKNNKFDIVLALNIFHHFIKTEELHNKLIKLLNNLQMKVMFFEPHHPSEMQMKDAYRNYSNEEFINFILSNSCLNNVELLGHDTHPSPLTGEENKGRHKRYMYKLTI